MCEFSENQGLEESVREHLMDAVGQVRIEEEERQHMIVTREREKERMCRQIRGLPNLIARDLDELGCPATAKKVRACTATWDMATAGILAALAADG